MINLLAGNFFFLHCRFFPKIFLFYPISHERTFFLILISTFYFFLVGYKEWLSGWMISMMKMLKARTVLTTKIKDQKKCLLMWNRIKEKNLWKKIGKKKNRQWRKKKLPARRFIMFKWILKKAIKWVDRYREHHTHTHTHTLTTQHTTTQHRQYNTIQHNITHHSTTQTQHNGTQHNTQHTTQHNTTQHT